MSQEEERHESIVQEYIQKSDEPIAKASGTLLKDLPVILPTRYMYSQPRKHSQSSGLQFPK